MLDDFVIQPGEVDTPQDTVRWVLDVLQRMRQQIILESADLGSGGAGGGKVLQDVWSTLSTLQSGTTQIPRDNTIPQNTEGDQYLTTTITPAAATNYLVIDACLMLATSGFGQIQMALFQDSTANALAAVTTPQTALGIMVPLKYRMLAGTTSATTFKIRAGGNNAGTTYVNASNNNQLFGGVEFSWLRVSELSP